MLKGKVHTSHYKPVLHFFGSSLCFPFPYKEHYYCFSHDQFDSLPLNWSDRFGHWSWECGKMWVGLEADIITHKINIGYTCECTAVVITGALESMVLVR